MDIYEQVRKISNQQDFGDFLRSLIKNHQEKSEEWENNNLENFLKGLEGYCSDKSFESPSWRAFGELLLAAKVYE